MVRDCLDLYLLTAIGFLSTYKNTNRQWYYSNAMFCDQSNELSELSENNLQTVSASTVQSHQ